MSTTYIPGVCNIGPAEIRRRHVMGYAGLVVTAALFEIFYFSSSDALWRLIIFVPATFSAMGFLQAYLHFCAKYGMSGLFNVGDDMKQQYTVDQVEFRKKDQQKAIMIMVGSVVIGLLVALLAYFLPFAS